MKEEGPQTFIQDFRPGMKRINCRMIVLEKTELAPTRSGRLFQFLVADNSASIFFSVFDELGEAIETGDILSLHLGYCLQFKGSLFLYVGKEGTVKKLGEITMLFKEIPNMSHFLWKDLDSNNTKPNSRVSWTPFPGSPELARLNIVPNMHGQGFVHFNPDLPVQTQPKPAPAHFQGDARAANTLIPRDSQDQRSEKYERNLKSAYKPHFTIRDYKKESSSAYKSGNYNTSTENFSYKSN